MVMGNDDQDDITRCRICGVNGELSKEHVLPKSWHNNRNLSWSDRESHNGVIKTVRRKRQRGFTVSTVCRSCNNGPLSHHQSKFVRYINDIKNLGSRSAVGSFIEMTPPGDHRDFLRVVVGMILAVNIVEFGDNNPDLRKFVLGHLDKIKLPFDVYAFYAPDKEEVGTIQRLHARVDTFAKGYGLYAGEISMHPIGFVYGFNFGEHYKIEHFAHIGHWAHVDNASICLRLPVRMTGIDSLHRMSFSRNGPEYSRHM